MRSRSRTPAVGPRIERRNGTWALFHTLTTTALRADSGAARSASRIRASRCRDCGS